MFLRCFYDIILYLVHLVHFVYFVCFLFLKGHRESLSEPGVSCSESMSLVLHCCIFGFEQINDDGDAVVV